MPAPYDIVFRLQVQTPPGVGSGIVSSLQSQLRGARLAVPVDVGTAGARSAATALTRVKAEAVATTATMSGLSTAVAAASTNLGNFGTQAGLAARRFLAFGVAAGSILQLVAAVRQGIAEAVKFDLEMNKLAQVSGESADRIRAIREEIGKLSVSLGVSSAELAKVAVTLKQAGLSANETREALLAIALTDLAPNFDSMRQTTEGIIAVQRQFKVESKDFVAVLGSMNAVAGEFAVEAGDLVTAIQKAGGSFAAVAGQTKEPIQALAEFQALITSVRATTRESADQIATGLRTVFTRLQRADTVDALREFGIQLRYTQAEAKALGDINLENQFVGAYEAVRRIGEGLKDLRPTDPRFSAITEQLGGYRQISRVIPLVQQQELAQKAVNVAIAGQVSLQIAAEKRQEALANRVEKVKETYLELFRRVAESDGFQGLAKGATDLAIAFAKALDAARPLLPVIAAFGVAQLATGLAGFTKNATSSFFAHVGTTGQQVKQAPVVRRFATGGVVPGHGDTDSVPAMLMPGEFVIRKSSARAIGYDRLHEINSGKGVRKHIAGGPSGQDTIPALLTPGEFVFSRESVARIGADELDHMNRFGRPRRYATGGYVAMQDGGDPTTALRRQVPDDQVASFQKALYSLVKTIIRLERELREGTSGPSGQADLDNARRRAATIRQKLGLPEDPDLVVRPPQSTVIRVTPQNQYELGQLPSDKLTKPVVAPSLFAIANDPRQQKLFGQDQYIGTAAEYAALGREQRLELANQTRFFKDPSFRPTYTQLAIEAAQKGSLSGPLIGQNKDQFDISRVAAYEAILAELGYTLGEPTLDPRSGIFSAVVAKPSAPTPAPAPQAKPVPPGSALARFRAKQGVQRVTVASGDVYSTDRNVQERVADTVAAELAADAPPTPARRPRPRPKVDLTDAQQQFLEQNLSVADRYAASIYKKQVAKGLDVGNRAESDIQAVALEALLGVVGNLGQPGFETDKFSTSKKGNVRSNAQAKLFSAISSAVLGREGVLNTMFAKGSAMGELGANADALPSRDTVVRSVNTMSGNAGVVAGPDSEAEAEQLRRFDERNRAERLALQTKLTEEAIGRPLPTTYAEQQQTLKALGLKGGGNAEELNERLVGAARAKVFLPKLGESIGDDMSGPLSLAMDRQVATGLRSGKQVAVAYSELGKFFRLAAVSMKDLYAVNEQLKEAADDAGLLEKFLKDKARVVVSVRDGLVQVRGFQRGSAAQAAKPGRPYRSPKRSGDPDTVDEILADTPLSRLEQREAENRQPIQDILARVKNRRFFANMRFDEAGERMDRARRNPPLTAEEIKYQEAELYKARYKYGAEYGTQSPPRPEYVSADEIAAGMANEARIRDVRRFRDANRPLAVDPLIEARDTRQQRALEREGRRAGTLIALQAQRETEGLRLEEVDAARRGRDAGPGGGPGRSSSSYRKVVDAFSLYDDARLASSALQASPEASRKERKAAELAVAEAKKRFEAEFAAVYERPVEAKDRAALRAGALPRLDGPGGRAGTTTGSGGAGAGDPNSPADRDRERDRQRQRVLGTADPLQIKQAAITAFREGNGGDDLLQVVRQQLNRAVQAGAFKQYGGNEGSGRALPEAEAFNRADLIYRQVEAEARRAGFAGAGVGSGRQAFMLTSAQQRADGTTFDSGLIATAATQAAEAKYAERGGRQALSQQTKDAIYAAELERAQNRIRRELISAEERLLKAINPNIEAHEAHRIATENAARAMAGEARVVRDASGRLLGIESTVQDASRSGLSAPGASQSALRPSFSERLNGAREWLENSRLGRLGRRLDEGAIGRTLSSPASLVASSIVVPMAVNKLDSIAGDAAVAANSESSRRTYSTAKGASGFIQGAFAGAAVGGTVGSVIPGVGTAIGAAAGAGIGGVTGLALAIKDAERDIRDARVGQAMATFADRLQTLVNIGPLSNAESASTQVSALQQLQEARNGQREKAIADATGLFGGVDIPSFVANSRRQLRQDFGGQLPQLNAYLQTQAQQLAKDNPRANADELVANLRDRNGGLNREFAAVVGGIRGLSLDQVFNELKKDIVRFQQDTQRSESQRRASELQDRSVYTFGRLVQAVQVAADSMSEFRRRTQATFDILDGNVSGGRVSASSDNISQFGRRDGAALKPLRTIAGATGGVGEELLAAGQAIDEAARVLPAIIAEATSVSRGNVSGDDFAKEVTDRLRERLGGRIGGLDVVAGVQGRLAEEGKNGPEGIFSQIRVDATAFTQKLLEPFAGPVQKAGQEAARLLEDNANAVAEAIGQAAARVRQAAELKDQAGFLRQSAARQAAEFAADRAGRRGGAIDALSLDQLEAGFNAQQRRLGATAGNPFSEEAIGRRLTKLSEELREATGRQQDVFARSGGGGKEYQEAADKVVRLKVEAANLQQALRNLADATTRTAAAQEKLARLAQEQDSRLGLAERYATADGAERARLDRGLILANQANNGRGLDTFSVDDRRLLIEVLRSAGGTTLSGFKGAPRADDLLRRLLTEQGGGAFALDPNQRAERDRLQDIVKGRNERAARAAEKLGGFQESEAGRFLKDLGKAQDDFLKKLATVLLSERQTAVQNALGEVAARRQEANQKIEARNTLAGLGITTDDQLNALRNNRGELEKYRAGLVGQREVEGKLRSAAGATSQFDGRLDNFLQQFGLDSDSAFVARLTQRFERGVEKAKKDGRYSGRRTEEEKRVVDREILRQALLEESRYDGPGSLYESSTRQIRESRSKLRNIPGLRVDQLDNALADDKKSGDLFRGLDALKGPEAFKKLDADLAELTKRRQALEAEQARIADVFKNIAGGAAPPATPATPPKGGGTVKVPGFASGGEVGAHPGEPMGTDTVPAWLTPGEFVVNAAAARANLPLLERLNSARGPMYLADGGGVDPYGRAGLFAAQRAGWKRAMHRLLPNDLAWAMSDRAAFNLAARGQALSFNAQASVASLPARPGEEGQLSLAASAYRRLQEVRAQAARENDGVQRATARRFSNGGRVQYLAAGGMAGAAAGMSGGNDGYGAADRLAQAAQAFARPADALAKAIESMPRTITLQGQHTVSVVFNGAEVLASLTPQIQQMINAGLRDGFNRIFREQMPDAGVRVG